MKQDLTAIYIGAFAVLALFCLPSQPNVNAEVCEDIAGVQKWDSEGHSDNSPSENQFFNDMNENTFCEHAQGIDHMEYKGAVREDTKHDWQWFKTTMVFESAGEDTQIKLKELYDLPDSGKKNLAAYEFLEAIYSD